MTPETKWSIEWWKERHRNVYFPVMDWHKDWKVCPYPPPEVMERIKPDVNEVGLEIGCGYGEWMVPLHLASTSSLKGIDISPILEKKAEEIFKQHGIGCGCEFRLCDGISIPYYRNTFDFVYSISVFQHIPRSTVLGYFGETNRVLKPGGRILFHFRRADGIGEYSHDITVNHKGDFSTGWTPGEVKFAAMAMGWVKQDVWWDKQHSLYLYAEKPTYENAKQAG